MNRRATCAWLVLALGAPAAAQERPRNDELVQLLAELPAEGVTAAVWATRHPSERVERYDGPDDVAIRHDTERWCLRFVRTGQLADGASWKRTTYFYEPAPTADLTLPSAPSESLIMRCRLGLAWVEIETGAARPILAQAAASVLGPGRAPQQPLGVGGFGAAFWSEVEEWHRGEVHVVVGVVAGRVGSLETDRNADTADPDRPRSTKGRAFFRWSVPTWDHHEQWDRDELISHRRDTEEERRQRHLADLKESVRALPRIDEKVRSAMVALLEGGRSDLRKSGTKSSPSEIVAAFEAWTTAVNRLDPEERASALLVTDELAQTVGLPLPDDDATIMEMRGRIQVAGAEFEYSKLGAAWAYAHTFLRKAAEIAPPGPARDRALLREMAMGFNYTGMCDAGDDEFDQVIATGEPLIRRTRDPEVLSEARFMVADAYATIVALAHGAGRDYADPAQYRPREATARRSAIEHYRAALALDPTSQRARAARRVAWRLLAGLAPEYPTYWCVYD